MKRISYLVVLLMLAMPFVGMAQEKKITFDEKKYQEEYNALNQKEWTSLFNGKDLQGWKLLEGKVPFIVKDGVIQGTATDDTTHSSFLSTTKEYSDFIFEVDFKMDRWMNSGIQFRSHYDPHYRTGEVYGDQVEIEGSERRWTGGIFDQSRRGWWLGGLDDNKAGLEAYKPNQWNHMRLVVIGPYIKTWINGVATASILDDKDTTGFIALQLHHSHNHGIRAVHEGAQIKFKNIQIKAKE